MIFLLAFRRTRRLLHCHPIKSCEKIRKKAVRSFSEIHQDLRRQASLDSKVMKSRYVTAVQLWQTLAFGNISSAFCKFESYEKHVATACADRKLWQTLASVNEEQLALVFVFGVARQDLQSFCR